MVVSELEGAVHGIKYVIILNSETHKLLLPVTILDVPLPYTMASQGNPWAGACYQLPVLGQKCSCWVSWLRKGRTWKPEELRHSVSPCAAHTVSTGSWYRSALISGCISWGPLSLKDCFLPYSTKEKDFMSGKQLLTFAWHLSKIQTFVKFHTLRKAFHSQQLKCEKILHFLWSVPQTLTAPFQDQALGSQSIPCVCVSVGYLWQPFAWSSISLTDTWVGAHSPKLRSFWGIISAGLLPNQPGIDMETESQSFLNKHSGSTEHTQGHTRLDEEVVEAPSWRCLRKQKQDFFSLLKWIGNESQRGKMGLGGSGWCISTRRGSVFENKWKKMFSG